MMSEERCERGCDGWRRKETSLVGLGESRWSEFEGGDLVSGAGRGRVRRKR